MSALFDLSGKVAIVTGANTGLGQGLAIGLVEAGAAMVAMGRTDPAETLARIKDKGGRAAFVKANLDSIAKLDDAEINANRNGGSNDAKADAAVRFAVKVATERGHVSDADVKSLRDAGYEDGEVVEIVLHVAVNTWTNYFNEVAGTEIDFPVAAPLAK